MSILGKITRAGRTATKTANGAEKHARKQKYRGNATIDPLGMQQFVLAVKRGGGLGNVGQREHEEKRRRRGMECAPPSPMYLPVP